MEHMVKSPDVRINARTDVAVVRLAVDQARTPSAEVTLDLPAIEELIRELMVARDVARGRFGFGPARSYSLRAFAPKGTVR